MQQVTCGIRVHIAAQPANQYIVVFRIAISYNTDSRTRQRQSRDTHGGHSSTIYTEVMAVMHSLQMRSLTDLNPQTF